MVSGRNKNKLRPICERIGCYVNIVTDGRKLELMCQEQAHNKVFVVTETVKHYFDNRK